MNALFLPQTGPLGPSSRYRIYQLLPLLEQQGITCTVSPGIPDPLYDAIYRHGAHKKLPALHAIWRQRRRDLARATDFDVIVVQKGFFPGLYAGLELKLARCRPLVFDFDDAIWLPRHGGSRLLRAVHRERAVQQLLRCATAVIAGNAFLAEYARQFNQHVTIIPSSVATDVPQHATDSQVVGWIGSRTTLPYLQPLAPVLAELNIVPRIIAAGDPATLNFDCDFRQWTPESELTELTQLGIGLAPLPDDAWERGKCGVKLLQYMACGIPVIASPVGANAEIVQDGVNGFLAHDAAEWTTKLRQLLADAGLRAKLGQAGRETVMQRYDLCDAAAAVAVVLHKAAAANTHTNGITGKQNRISATPNA